MLLYHPRAVLVIAASGLRDEGTTTKMTAAYGPCTLNVPQHLPLPTYRDCWHGNLSGLHQTAVIIDRLKGFYNETTVITLRLSLVQAFTH